MVKKYDSVEAFIEDQGAWTEGLMAIHEMIMQMGFDASLKWGIPVYHFGSTNLIGFFTGKQFVSLAFFQGVLLVDPSDRLINAQEGKTKSMRQWRFTAPDELDMSMIKGYVREVKHHFESGNIIKPERSTKTKINQLLVKTMENEPELKKAFDKFTPYKQREFSEYIESAKRDQTKLDRLHRIIPMIRSGTGLHDKYRK